MANDLGIASDLDTSTDGTPLNMKNDSPNKFLGGIAAGLTGGRVGSVGGFSGILNSTLGRAAQQAAGQSQAQQAAAVNSLPGGGGVMGAADQNPMTGGAGGGQTLNCTPVAMSYDPPLQANEKGGKKSVFNMNTRGMAETAFGTPAMRQASVGSAFQVSAKQEAAFGPDSKLAKEDPTQAKKIYDGIKAGESSPAASYENPQTVVDNSGGYIAAKALDTFGNLAGDFITKKYGKEQEQE